MSCSACDVPPSKTPAGPFSSGILESLSLVDMEHREPDGYPFSLSSLLGPEYVRTDFTTTSKEPLEKNVTLTWLNRALGWTYGFNHDEARVCYEKAIASDPEGCPMAHFGLAWTSSPNYNKPICLEPEDETSRKAALKAKEVADRCGSDWEKLVCDAMVKRHIVEGKPEVVRKDAEGRDILNKQYAQAMQAVYDQLYKAPNFDPDIASLCAEAHMQLSPWKLWPAIPYPADDYTHNPRGDTVSELTAHIMDILHRGLHDKPENKHHTGLVHFWIHLWEMSPTPENGLELAEWMRTATRGGAGHLLHMPSHLDVLTGRYKEGVRANEEAWVADQRFLKHNNTTYYNLYIIHDLHLLIYSGMFQGAWAVTWENTQNMISLCTEQSVKTWPDYLESYVPLPIHVLIRFGKFEEILAMPFPEDRELYCSTVASLYYGRGIAKAALGDVKGAREEQALMREARAKVPKSRMHFQVSVDQILAISEEMLEGEILFREGDEKCYEHLRKAVALDDSLPYMEPWGWMVPARHALAALLLARDHADQAIGVYRSDMAPTKHPDNIWSLRGLLECLEKLGPKAELTPGETEVVRKKVAERSRDADMEIKVSCFCRR